MEQQAVLIDNRTGEIVTADDAWERRRRIVNLRYQIEEDYLSLAEELFWAYENKDWEEDKLDCVSWNAYLADPEVDIEQRKAQRLIEVYELYIITFNLAPVPLLTAGYAKLHSVIPCINAQNVHDVVADAGSLSRSDLIKKYGGPTSGRDDYSSDDWHTPTQYIEAAREVMGDIDLDPATCETAQEVVQADAFFTKDMEGLDRRWHGRVWLNPPYSMPSIAYFVAKVLDEYDQHHITEAIVLVNNSSDTKWFHRLLDRCLACFTAGRVQFWHPDYKTFATRQGQAVFYLGANEERFADVFSQFGIVVEKCPTSKTSRRS